VRPSTVRTRDYQLRQAASALVCRGRAPQTITGVADLVALESFKEILRYLIERRDGVAAGQVGGIAMLLKSIARHQVKVPAETLDAMSAIIRRIETRRRGMTDANRARLRPLDERSHALALVQLPNRLLAEARRAKHARQGALLTQTALAVELLLMAPIRIGNLAGLDIERHIVRGPNGRQVCLVLESHEVKNREPLEYPLPADSVSLLDIYLRDHRPLLAAPGCTALFPGQGGRPKARNSLGVQISQTISRYTGLHVNPHLFRHIAAKFYLDSHPGAYEVVRRVLGHRSMDTTTAFYTGLETAAAVRHFDAAILRLRNGAKAA
jgi:integrase